MQISSYDHTGYFIMDNEPKAEMFWKFSVKTERTSTIFKGN